MEAKREEMPLRERLAEVEERLAAACARAGRRRDEVRLLPVTKTFGPDAVAEAAACGLRAFGESRVQEAKQKIPLCPGGIAWHMVGHLQRNKVRDAVGLFRMIHSVDSLRLLEAIDEAAAESGGDMPVCLEVNIAGEASKFGLPPAGVRPLLDAAARLSRVSVVGLMAVPPFRPEPEGARPFFRELRRLRDGLRAQTGFDLAELSMGMSHDYEVAVEEGATLVRIGTALFGTRCRRGLSAGAVSGGGWAEAQE